MGEPARLPNFSDLCREIAQDTGKTLKSGESEDRFLGRLQHRGVQVHQRAKQALEKRCPKPTDLHRNLLRIHSGKAMRIVTTNFDLLFEQSMETTIRDSASEVFSAPALPLGNEFKGIVHVHGTLDRPEDMVLTDADFGRAYLTEGWARRFLIGLFRSFTVLFVGYSHDDLVMNYLARALTAGETQRFALTDREGDDQWDRLGIMPIVFPKDELDTLHAAVRRIADYATRGILDWRHLITETAKKPPPHDQETVELLDEALSDEARTRFFTDVATLPRWIEWLEEHRHLNPLFHEHGQLDSPQRLLANWLADGFARNRPEDLWILIGRHGMHVHPEFWRALAVAVGSPEQCQPDRDNVSRWVSVLLATAPPVAPDFVFRNLADRCVDCKALDSVIDIFEVVTTARLRISRFPKELYGDAYGERAPIIDAELDASSDDARYAADYIWTSGLKPNLAQIAHALIVRIVANFEQQHRTLCWWRSASRERDSLSDRRAAIEPHEQEAKSPRTRNVLIDAARDCLQWITRQHTSMAAHWCDQLVFADPPILRRLAIHCMTERRDLSPNEKIDWLLQRSILHERSARHEVFRALQVSYPGADLEQRTAVVQEILRERWSRAEGDGERIAAACHFRWLERLVQAAPDCKVAKAALSDVRHRYPELEACDYPDLNGWTITQVGHRTPWEYEELLASAPSDWIDRLVTFQPKGALGSDRPGLLGSVRNAANHDFDWGLALADVLLQRTDWESDLWNPILDSWVETEFDTDQCDRVLQRLSRIELHGTQTRPIACVLKAISRRSKVYQIADIMDKADCIASALWGCSDDENVAEECENWWIEATSHPAGILAEYWMNRFTSWIERESERSIGMGRFRNPFSQIVQDETRLGRLGRSVLASNFYVLLSADDTWTIEYLLPWFRDHSNKADYQAVWDGFLSRALSPTVSELMEESFFRGVGHIKDELDGKDRRREFVEGYTVLLSYFAEDPVGKWIPELFRHGAEEDRLTFAREIGEQLEGMSDARQKDLWERWLKHYWLNRVQGVPERLQDREIWEMLEWLPLLPRVFSDAVDVAIQMPNNADGKPGPEELSLLFRISESSLTETCPESVARLILYLGESVRHSGWYEEGKGIVDRLLQCGLPPEVDSRLRELVATGGLGRPA